MLILLWCTKKKATFRWLYIENISRFHLIFSTVGTPEGTGYTRGIASLEIIKKNRDYLPINIIHPTPMKSGSSDHEDPSPCRLGGSVWFVLASTSRWLVGLPRTRTLFSRFISKQKRTLVCSPPERTWSGFRYVWKSDHSEPGVHEFLPDWEPGRHPRPLPAVSDGYRLRPPFEITQLQVFTLLHRATQRGIIPNRLLRRVIFHTVGTDEWQFSDYALKRWDWGVCGSRHGHSHRIPNQLVWKINRLGVRAILKNQRKALVFQPEAQWFPSCPISSDGTWPYSEWRTGLIGDWQNPANRNFLLLALIGCLQLGPLHGMHFLELIIIARITGQKLVFTW